MKMERLSQDKIRIFLTFDDLSERGIEKDDLWREIPKVHELFSEMMEQAHMELGFEASGPLAVEVFSLQSQGMVVIVTRGKVDLTLNASDDDDAMSDEDIYEMEVTLEESDEYTYVFYDLDDIVNAAKSLHIIDLLAGTMYSYQNRYYLRLLPQDIDADKIVSAVAILSEYGNVSTMTTAVLEEYGTVVAEERAVEVLCKYF